MHLSAIPVIHFESNDLTTTSLEEFEASLAYGYLTVKDYDDGLFTLGVPDEEVRRDLATLIAGAAADEDMQWASSVGAKMLTAQWRPIWLVGLTFNSSTRRLADCAAVQLDTET